MFKQTSVVLILTLLGGVQSHEENPSTNEVLSDQELMLAVVVNRHGDSSPDEYDLSLSDQQEAIRNLTYIEGLEGLSHLGKRTAYQLGKHIRQRYGPQGLKLISNDYLRDEILIQSTDKERTKMTIQIAMAAVYPPKPEQQWDKNVGQVWQPVPYVTVPLKEDHLRFYTNCDKFTALMEEEKRVAAIEEFKPYDDLIPLLLQKTGRNFTENPLLFQSLVDLLESTLSLGLDIPAWSKPLLPRLIAAARQSYLLHFRNNQMKKLAGGVLLNTFIEAAESIISGKPVTQRLKLYSSHDFNLGALMKTSRVVSDYSIPAYGSVFALELYRSKNGKYSVLPVYLPVAGSSPLQELQISGCGSDDHGRCDFEKFSDLTKEFRLTERDYFKMCNIRTEL